MNTIKVGDIVWLIIRVHCSDTLNKCHDILNFIVDKIHFSGAILCLVGPDGDRINVSCKVVYTTEKEAYQRIENKIIGKYYE